MLHRDYRDKKRATMQLNVIINSFIVVVLLCMYILPGDGYVEVKTREKDREREALKRTNKKLVSQYNIYRMTIIVNTCI